MKDDKKGGIAALILSKHKPEMEDEDGDDGQMMAIEDMMLALKDNDAEMFKSALDAYLDMRD